MRTLLKVLLVLAVIAVGTIALLIMGGVFLARNIHVQESGTEGKKNVSIETPFGQFGIHAKKKLNPEAVGIPIYPGAKLSAADDSGGADFQIDAGNVHKDWSVAGAKFYTDDSEDKVKAYYEEKFPDWKRKTEKGEFSLEDTGDGRIRVIGIKREDDRTRIAVASIGDPASN